ncbi:ankyrin [Tuber magnatum]|uniref:Ankyrin n=1 Tax=Tuber magnatum TaxID=42249 RepID=A0A317SFQ9_9PEZI|nr:ankyrin [Tuber magnatum]
MRAVEQGHVEVIKLLLSKEADVNAHSGWALEKAARWRHKKVVKILLENGADVDKKSLQWALEESARGGSEKSVEMLLGAWSNARAWNGLKGNLAPLYSAALDGHEKMVMMLLDAGAEAYGLDLFDIVKDGKGTVGGGSRCERGRGRYVAQCCTCEPERYGRDASATGGQSSPLSGADLPGNKGAKVFGGADLDR